MSEQEKQIEEMANILWHIPDGYYLNSYKDCKTIAECIYEQDYRKERQGEWLISGKCTLCKEYSPIHSKYCPYCGAKMKGAE